MDSNKTIGGLWVGLLGLSLWLSGCSIAPTQPEEPDTSRVVLVDVAGVAALVEAGIPVWDVRTPEEWAEGHLATAALVPKDTLPQAALASLGRDEAVLLYCRSGNRALKSGNMMADAGYTRVHVLRPGGYAQLQAAGFNVIPAKN